MCVVYVRVCAGINAYAHMQRTKWGAGCFTLGQSLLEPCFPSEAGSQQVSVILISNLSSVPHQGYRCMQDHNQLVRQVLGSPPQVLKQVLLTTEPSLELQENLLTHK